MTNRKLTITWKPDALTNALHDGSFKYNVTKKNLVFREDTNRNRLTARSERETFRNVKSKEAAQRILSRRNKKEILFADYAGEVIYSLPKE